MWFSPSLLMKTLSSQRDLQETEVELSQDSRRLPLGLWAGADVTFLSPLVSPGGAGGYFLSHSMLQPLSHDSCEEGSDCTGPRNYGSVLPAAGFSHPWSQRLHTVQPGLTICFSKEVHQSVGRNFPSLTKPQTQVLHILSILPAKLRWPWLLWGGVDNQLERCNLEYD